MVWKDCFCFPSSCVVYYTLIVPESEYNDTPHTHGEPRDQVFFNLIKILDGFINSLKNGIKHTLIY